MSDRAWILLGAEQTKCCDPGRLSNWVPRRKHSLLKALFHLLYGIESAIPVCCSAWYAWRCLRGAMNAKESACWNNPSCHSGWVHCPRCAKRQHLHITEQCYEKLSIEEPGKVTFAKVSQ